jgi:DNA-binding transcriptional MerR regulator
MGTYSIKDIEQLSGIKAHTIRSWESRYQLIEPKRTDTNIRYYDDEQLKFILNVSLLLKNGHKISKVSSLDTIDFIKEIEKVYEQSLLHDTTVKLDLDSNDLMVSMIDMDTNKFHRIYENSVKNNGFETTVTGLIYPFLEKVGILWTLGQINPSHEHFISCLIRQKIISGIDRLEQPISGKKFFLFLPAGEHHEIGLLMAHYLLKKNGARVYYLGQNLPTKDVEAGIQTIKPDVVLSFFVDPAVIGNGKSLIENLREWGADAQILIACRPSPEVEGLDKGNVNFLHKMEDLYSYIQ